MIIVINSGLLLSATLLGNGLGLGFWLWLFSSLGLDGSLLGGLGLGPGLWLGLGLPSTASLFGLLGRGLSDSIIVDSRSGLRLDLLGPSLLL